MHEDRRAHRAQKREDARIEREDDAYTAAMRQGMSHDEALIVSGPVNRAVYLADMKLQLITRRSNIV